MPVLLEVGDKQHRVARMAGDNSLAMRAAKATDSKWNTMHLRCYLQVGQYDSKLWTV